MKKLIFILSFMIISYNAFAVDCTEPYVGFDCDSVTYHTDTIISPYYPDCPIRVDYKKTVCIDPNTGHIKVFFNITGYMIPGSSNCADFYEDNTHPDGSHNWEFSVWFEYHAFEQLAMQDFWKSYDDALPNDKHRYECPNNGFFRASLVKTHCTYQGYVNVSGPSWPPEYSVWYLPCDGDICCEKTIELCYNVVTEELETIQNVMQHTIGDCGTPDPPDFPPLDGITPCYHDCYIPQR